MKFNTPYEEDGLRGLEFAFKGGGKGAAPAPVAPIVNPVAPVEESSVEIGEDTEKKKKLKTGKSELKLPLANTADTGLKI